ncbi:MAG: HEAT repeat domain-containing protein [Planctomycetota bacterium]
MRNRERTRSAAAILAVVPWLAACAGSGHRAAEDRAARMVPVAELPERQREVLAAWRRGGAEWEAERARVAADPELARFFVENLIVLMVRAFDGSAIATAANPDRPFDRAQAELVRWEDRSTEVLVELLGVRDGIVAYLAADTLKRIGGAAVRPASEKLSSEDPELRRRAAELLGELPPSREIEARVLEQLGERVERDEAWIVRAQAARALGSRGSRLAARGPAAAALTRALRDPEPEVVKSAVSGLGVLGELSAVPPLIQCLERAARDGDLARVRAAQAALRRLLREESDLSPDDWWERWRTRD